MSNLDKELEKILVSYRISADHDYSEVIDGVESQYSYEQALKQLGAVKVAQIKSTILEAIEAEWPKEKAFITDHNEGYEESLVECLSVVRKTLQ